MATANPDSASRAAATDATLPTELLDATADDVDTLTGAVVAGDLSVDEIDRLVRRADREGAEDGVVEVARIVASLLGDEEPGWVEAEAASSRAGA